MLNLTQRDHTTWAIHQPIVEFDLVDEHWYLQRDKYCGLVGLCVKQCLSNNYLIFVEFSWTSN